MKIPITNITESAFNHRCIDSLGYEGKGILQNSIPAEILIIAARTANHACEAHKIYTETAPIINTARPKE